jgi:hypothetical protein
LSSLQLAGHGGTSVTIDACMTCQAFWFDQYESLRLAPASTLRLFALIGERAAAPKTPLRPPLRCPRCRSLLLLTHDRQRSTPFRYYRCADGHGRLCTFFDFLREKDFVRPLTGPQLAELRASLHHVNCANCGAPVDIARRSDCDQCGSPLSMLDMKQAGALVAQLQAAAEPKRIDPALPLQLERVRRDVEATFSAAGGDREWWRDAPSSDLVEAGLAAVARWFRNRTS